MIVTFEQNQTENVFDIFWYEIFLVRNLVKTGQSCCSAVIKGRDGAVVQAVAAHQCGPGSNPGVDAICGFSLLLVLSFAPRGFPPGTLEIALADF